LRWFPLGIAQLQQHCSEISRAQLRPLTHIPDAFIYASPRGVFGESPAAQYYGAVHSSVGGPSFRLGNYGKQIKV